MAEFDAQIETAIQPFRGILQRLTAIPGISRVSTEQGYVSTGAVSAAESTTRTEESDCGRGRVDLDGGLSLDCDGQEYRDLGHDYFIRRDSHRVAQRLAKRIRELGYEVQISKAA